ncbi:MAG: alpha-glucuronidase [Prevotella sp.]
MKYHHRFIKTLLLAATAMLATLPAAKADNGHRLWLRMEQKDSACVTSNTATPAAGIAADELQRYWQGNTVHLLLDKDMADDEGFAICRNSDNSLTVKAHRDIGLLYGAYELLRRQQTGTGMTEDFTEEHPAFSLRILNHWDNLDGSIERGYAGKSIFWGEEGLPHDDILTMYARANASIGINATVLNNVNASPMMLSDSILYRVKSIADRLRPYGIKVFLSVNFASPIKLSKLKTADPLDRRVARWWKEKTDEVYRLIPDFGGYLVKANSEGQPGPGDYGRTHADGANMLADALAPHGGIVMWRSFVYGYHEGEDRVKKAVAEFEPLDGRFRPNVILQSKNGPLDFQPREPYSPIFDRMKRTDLMVEMQITQEYTGQSRHLVYLAPMWSEFFSFVNAASLKAIAGVANIGNDTNWCGHHFSQANWYAFGRMAWNPGMTPEKIAGEWLRQTFSSDSGFLSAVTPMMLGSREYCVDYMMPLGLHHIFKGDHHYGPEPEGNQPHFPDEWKPVWYHKADAEGIGFNRSSTGTDAVSQYREPYRSLYDNPQTCPEEYLLWFHHLPWDYKMADGTTLWQSLVNHYNHGVAMVDSTVVLWRQMAPYIDKQRFDEVERRLLHQQENAREWRDHCLNYFRNKMERKKEQP